MWKVYKTVLVLAAIVVLIGYFGFYKSPSSVPDTQPNSAQSRPESEPKAEAQPAPTGQDPFKKFLDEKSNNPNASVKQDKSQVVPAQTGKDPFKEFLDKQKQNSKDQVVSPFGKN